MQKTSLRLTDAVELANNVREFRFECDVDFKPGQFFLLDVQDGKDPAVTRAYSCASAPNGNSVNFCIKLIPEGRGTGYLNSLQVGDEAVWQGPFGHFTLGEPDSEIIFIATGVGIAPFMCMLEVLFAQGFDNQITLYFGVRNTDELFYEERLATWEQEHPNFKVVKTLSQPDEGWTGETGRVTEHLEKLDIPVSTDVFICGNGYMVKDVKKMMEEKGLPKEKIHFELFTPAT